MTLLGNIAHIIEDSNCTSYLIFRKDFLTWLNAQIDKYSNPNITLQGEMLRETWGVRPEDYGLVGIDDYRVATLNSNANQSYAEYISNVMSLIETAIELFYDYDEYLDKFESPAPTGDVKILA